MGSLTSKLADQQPLLEDTDEVPYFEEISVVLIGHHGVGKNTVGNAILKKKAFTFQDRSKQYYLKHENTISGRHISVTRVPGWSANLNSEKNCHLRRVIKDSVQSVREGPHVIILVVDMNIKPAERTKEILKPILGEKVLQHVLIVSVDSRKIVVYHHGRKQTNIDRCKHFVGCSCHKETVFIETIENFIIYKHDIRFYDEKKEPNLELQCQELTKLVGGLNNKISSLSKRLNSEHQEVRELKRVLREKEDTLRAKEEEIDRLKSNHSECSALYIRIEQLENKAQRARKSEEKREEEHQRNIKELEKIIEEKDKEIDRLKQENQALKSQNEKKTQSQGKTSSMRWRRKKPTKEEKSYEMNDLPPGETPDGEAQGSEVERAVQFLKKNRKALIENIVAVQPIVEDLFPLITRYKYDRIQQAPTEYERKRQLFEITDKGGTTLKEALYNSLLKHEEHLVDDLEKQTK